jgi:hypothetical protein
MEDFRYSDFVILVGNTYEEGSDIRYGQHYFNVLNRVRPDVANSLRGTSLDPFYRDKVSQKTEDFVAMKWRGGE